MFITTCIEKHCTQPFKSDSTRKSNLDLPTMRQMLLIDIDQYCYQYFVFSMLVPLTK